MKPKRGKRNLPLPADPPAAEVVETPAAAAEPPVAPHWRLTGSELASWLRQERRERRLSERGY
jgi:hypothetical protein